jgi:hypothetical protein
MISTLRLVTAASFAAGCFSLAAAPVPLLEYRFNDTGTTSASTGFNPAPLTLRSFGGAATDLHAPNLGVGGAGDTAFDNRASANSFGGWAEQSGDLDAFDGLLSFTITGWFKTDGTTGINNDQQLINNGWSLRAQGNDPGNLDLQVIGAGGAADAQSGGAFNVPGPYSQTQEWVFFAVTYDGGLTSNNVKFYQGSQTSGSTLVATRSLNVGASTNGSDTLYIGNYGSGDRAFDGLLDDIRLYGSKTNSAGVLTPLDLEVIRQIDVANVPEPGCLGALGAGLLCIGARRRRRS